MVLFFLSHLFVLVSQHDHLEQTNVIFAHGHHLFLRVVISFFSSFSIGPGVRVTPYDGFSLLLLLVVGRPFERLEVGVVDVQTIFAVLGDGVFLRKSDAAILQGREDRRRDL